MKNKNREFNEYLKGVKKKSKSEVISREFSLNNLLTEHSLLVPNFTRLVDKLKALTKLYLILFIF